MTIPRRPYRLLLNRHAGVPGVVVLPEGGFRRAKAEIASWPGYAPTPLLPLPELAAAARVAAIHWKDEGGRFGLGSFKALGGAYAVMKLLQAELSRRGVANAASAEELAEGAASMTHVDCSSFDVPHPVVTTHIRDRTARCRCRMLASCPG
jgi:diaminopropionate ammonia-lyase